MTLRTANRVRDTTTTTGTGTLTVTGSAPVGYIPFTSIPSIATNDTYLILIAHQTLNEWEICLGTHASSTTISRGAVEASSNAGSAVSFSAGTKDVVLVQTAGRTVLTTSLDLYSGGKINFGDANFSITHATGQLTVNGIIYMNNNLLGVANDTNHGIIYNGTVDGPEIRGFGGIIFKNGTTGGTELARLTSAAFQPGANDQYPLGTGTLSFSDLFLASGGNINFANSDCTIVHSTGGNLMFSGTNYFGNGNGFIARSDTTVGTAQFDGFTPRPQILSNFQDTASLALGAWLNSTNVSARIMFGRSRSGSIGGFAAVTNGDQIGNVQWCGADGTSVLRRCAEFRVDGQGTFSTTSLPTKMFLVTTPSGSTTPQDGITVSPDGSVRLPRATATTGTAANCFIDNADSQNLIRSTSSLRFKTNITDVPQHRIDRLKDLRLIEFTSTAAADNKQSRFIGLAAEEVALIDPDLVTYGYRDEDWIWPTGRTPITSPKLRPDAKLIPDGVQYDRVLLLQVAALQQRVAELEGRLQ